MESTSSTKKSRHHRGNSIFRSFSGQLSSSSASSNKKTYGKKKPTHNSTLSQSHIDKQIWDQPDSGNLSAAIDAALEIKASPSLSEMSSISSPATTSPSTPSSSIASSSENFSMDALELTSALPGPDGPTHAKAKQRPMSSVSVASTSTVGPDPLKTLSSNSSCSRSSSIVRSKHTSTTSTVSTLRHFSIISVDGNRTETLPEVQHEPATVQEDVQHLDIAEPSRYDFDTPTDSATPTSNSFQHSRRNSSFSYSINTKTTTASTPLDSPASTRSPHTSGKSFPLGMHSNGSTNSMLSYKKEDLKYRRKVSKASISLPTGPASHEEHFADSPTASPREQGFTKGHRSRNSVIASISPSAFFKPFKRNPSPTRTNLGESRTPYASSSTTQLSTQRSKNSFTSQTSQSSQVSHTASKKHSFANMRESFRSMSPSTNLFRSSNNNLSSRKSFLGIPSFNFQSSGSSESTSYEKPMISLPTPVDTSREKLKNKLRASTSLLSLTRPDMNGSAVAVPVEQHNLSQMEKLLHLCKTPAIMDFHAYIERAQSQGEISKLNEASYSEVFIQENENTGASKIFKIIPFGNEELHQSPIQDILQELNIAKLVMNLDGFVDILDVAVVKGQYPDHLLQLWDEYNDDYGSENYRPDTFSDNQLYCVIVQSNAGTDLERYELASWVDAESVFWQTVVALAEAEERYNFEHRDLHWGNIVISDKMDETTNTEDLMHKLTLTDSGNPVTPSSPSTISSTFDAGLVEETRKQLLANSTLKITLIDYTLSRANNPDGGVVHTRLDQPEFFRGKGDYQFDIYRFMRSHVMASHNLSRSSSVSSSYSHGDDNSLHPPRSPLPPPSVNSSRELDGSGVDWSAFCPLTNVLWLHYVADKLVNHKDLQYVASGRSNRMAYRGTNASCTSLHDTYLGSDDYSNSAGSDRKSTFEGDLMAEEVRACKSLETIHKAIDPRKKRLGGGSKKPYSMNMTFQDFHSANDVLKWGVKNKVLPSQSATRG